VRREIKKRRKMVNKIIIPVKPNQRSNSPSSKE